MSYRDSLGRWVEERPIVLHASASRTATGVTDGVLLGRQRSLSLLLDVTVENLTGFVCTVQTSNDNTNWRTLVAFADQNTVGSLRVSAGGADKYVRLSYVITGTSLTFSVIGVAV
jgi:hypothetical protein